MRIHTITVHNYITISIMRFVMIIYVYYECKCT